MAVMRREDLESQRSGTAVRLLPTTRLVATRSPDLVDGVFERLEMFSEPVLSRHQP